MIEFDRAIYVIPEDWTGCIGCSALDFNSICILGGRFNTFRGEVPEVISTSLGPVLFGPVPPRDRLMSLRNPNTIREHVVKNIPKKCLNRFRFVDGKIIRE